MRTGLGGQLRDPPGLWMTSSSQVKILSSSFVLPHRVKLAFDESSELKTPIISPPQEAGVDSNRKCRTLHHTFLSAILMVSVKLFISALGAFRSLFMCEIQRLELVILV